MSNSMNDAITTAVATAEEETGEHIAFKPVKGSRIMAFIPFSPNYRHAGGAIAIRDYSKPAVDGDAKTIADRDGKWKVNGAVICWSIDDEGKVENYGISAVSAGFGGISTTNLPIPAEVAMKAAIITSQILKNPQMLKDAPTGSFMLWEVNTPAILSELGIRLPPRSVDDQALLSVEMAEHLEANSMVARLYDQRNGIKHSAILVLGVPVTEAAPSAPIHLFSVELATEFAPEFALHAKDIPDLHRGKRTVIPFKELPGKAHKPRKEFANDQRPARHGEPQGSPHGRKVATPTSYRADALSGIPPQMGEHPTGKQGRRERGDRRDRRVHGLGHREVASANA